MQSHRTFDRSVYTLGSLLAKGFLLAPLLIAVLLFNFKVGGTVLTDDERYDIAMGQVMVSDASLPGYDSMDERQLLKLYVAQLEEAPQTIALGSSRILQLREELADGGSYYNCGMSGADFYDILGSFYLFDQAGKLPQNMIIGLDPWLLNGHIDAFTPRSDRNLYNEFLATCLGLPAEYEAPEPEFSDPLDKLVSVSYFRENLAYLYRDDSNDPQPKVVTGDIYTQPQNIMLGDGSVLYNRGFREVDEETSLMLARQQAATFLRMDDFHQLDAQLCDIFDRFVQYARSRGVNVIFVMTPYHPIVYNYATEYADVYDGFFLTEPWYTQYALANDIPIYGSYNPFVNDCFDEDFFDGYHIRPESLPKVFPGVTQVLAQQANNEAASPFILGERPRITPEAALRIAEEYYLIEEPHYLAPTENEEINGGECYVFERYDASQTPPLRLAYYAVSVDEGICYRYDTRTYQWVIDRRF